MVYEVHKFDFSLKKQYISNKKIYVVDNGLRNAVSFRTTPDKGQLLENLVFVELKRRNYHIWFYKTRNNYEIDFIIKDELPPILHSAEEKGTLVIPIILKPCRFTREKSLNKFQAINSPDEPICALYEYDRELIYDTVAQRIEELFGDKG